MANEITIVVGAKDEASAVFKKVEGSAGGLGSALASVGKIAGGFIVAEGLMKLPGLLFGAAQAAADDEAATVRLNKSLENLVDRGGAAGKSVADLTADMEERIKSGQKLAFTDDDVRDSMQQLLAATDDYGEATLRSKVAMDLARGANIPLKDASKLLGKINEDNIQVFKRMGITLTESATEAEALAEVQKKFGGQADAYAKSTAGQFEQAKVRMSEVKEEIGAALLPAMASIGTLLVTDVIPKLEELAEWMGPRVKVAAAIIKDDVFPVLRTFGRVFADDIWPYIETVIGGLGTLLGVLKDVSREIGNFVEMVGKIPTPQFVRDKVDAATGGSGIGGAVLGGAVRGAINAIVPGAALLGAIGTLAGGGGGDPVFAPGFEGMAKGGPVRAGQTVKVGESGIELLTMGSLGGHITPNNKLGGGGDTYNFYMSGDVYGMPDIERKLLDVLHNAQRRNVRI